MKQQGVTIEYIKDLGKNRNQENLEILLDLYHQDLPIALKREVVSSIGRQNDKEAVYRFISEYAFQNSTYMEIIYQMYRTCLYNYKDEKFKNLADRIELFYDNEMIKKMKEFYFFDKSIYRNKRVDKITTPTLLVGDSSITLNKLNPQSIQLIFTSPPYYNARMYSDYRSYQDYLGKMKEVLLRCYDVLEDGRFIIINVSPVITKRPGREFESIRYPIHFDFHRILTESGFNFVDEIIWIKPEYCVPNRNGGYVQTGKPLSYKPNCISESLLVYRKNASFLLDENIKKYPNKKIENDSFDATNCWYISPKSDKNHPAVFPEELCQKVIKYYSFEEDVVLDPFAGSGTFGRVAKKMKRIPVLCEINEEYIKTILKEGNYDIRK